MPVISMHDWGRQFYVLVKQGYGEITIQVHAYRNVELHLYRHPPRLIVHVTEHVDRGDTHITTRKTIVVRGDRAVRAYEKIARVYPLFS